MSKRSRQVCLMATKIRTTAVAFTFNAFDFASLQTLFERVADTWLFPRLTGYLKGAGLFS